MHLGVILSIPWMLIVRMKILLSNDRWGKWFDVTLVLTIIISTILTLLNERQVSSELTEYIYFEILSNILTLSFVVWMFRQYLLGLKSRVSSYEEEAWHHKWYYSLMLHLGHNLRTPLAAVNSNLEVIKFKVKDPSLRTSLERAILGGDRLKKMVNSLITASNMNHVKEQGDTVASILRGFVEQTDRSVDLADFDPYKVKIKGPEIVSFIMAIDAFTDNSLRYGASNVSIEMRHDHVLVKDNGPGLSVEVKERITHTSKEDNSHEGFGSSLHFVMTLLRESGWQVELVEWQQGVTFKLQRSIQNWTQKAISAS
jgi:signal transduction histidine kinase